MSKVLDSMAVWNSEGSAWIGYGFRKMRLERSAGAKLCRKSAWYSR